jgi:hypothetical protein
VPTAVTASEKRSGRPSALTAPRTRQAASASSATGADTIMAMVARDDDVPDESNRYAACAIV